MIRPGLNFLCLLDELPAGASRGFELRGVKIVGVRQTTGLYFYRNLCPHSGISLEWHEHQFLDDSRTLIQCAHHGALFVIHTGKCVAGPCSGQSLQPISHQLINNEVWIALP